MKALFYSQDIWNLMENRHLEFDGEWFSRTTDAAAYNALSQVERDLLRDKRKKDSKALFYIFQAVHESVFPRVAAVMKSKQTWDTLQTAYQGMEIVKKAKLQMLRRSFETFCMKESENVDLFFTHVSGMVTQIKSHGEILEERRIVEKVLRSLPARFDAIVVAIEETKDLSQFSVDELNASLISHEHRMNRATSYSLEHAFKTQVSFRQGRGRGRSYARGRGRSPHRGGTNSPSSSSGRGSNQNPSQGPSQNQAQGQRYDKSQVQCHYYKKYGHYINECRNKQYDISNKPNSWCSNYMLANIEMFPNLDESVKSEVTLGTDSKVSVMGKGRVNILTKKGKKKYISDVYFVPGLKYNLISIG
eukprot:PITA_36606